ncbi:MAG: hypothetical protein IPL05_09665 [Betaproteobacteria bacterium]|nr:hypothetical protein [Betaproteobacteria bacterium]
MDKNEGGSLKGNQKPSECWRVRRMPSSDGSKMLTGLYINTNKTADKNKDQFDRGYEVPVATRKVLYWLEKLRDWQEKYNPIDSPTPCEDFPTTVIGDKTPEQREAWVHCVACSRMRHMSCPHVRKMPIVNSQMVQLWKKILIELENVCAEKGHTAYDGSRLIFMAPEAREKYYEYCGSAPPTCTLFAFRSSPSTPQRG